MSAPSSGPAPVPAHRRHSTLLVVLVAVLACVLGSVGTATASGGLTKKRVQRIAAKVVKQKASSLSVANATTLNGRAASAYTSPTYVFTSNVPTSSPTTAVTVPVQLQPGNYLVGYSARLAGSAGGDADCVLLNGSSPVGESSARTTTFNPSLSGSAFVAVAAGQALKLTCTAQRAFTTGLAEPIQVTATRVDLVSTTAVPPQ